MNDDDALDPALEMRFRALDDVVVPDTWSARAKRPMRWQPWAAAAAVAALVVSGFVVLVQRGDGDEVIVGASVSSPAPSDSPSTPYLVADALATAEPAIVRPGEQVTITPAGVVQRYCDKVNVIGPEIGSMFGGTWSPGEEEVPATYSCDGPLTDEPLQVAVPYIAGGDYRFCIATFDIPEGCALVTVAGPSQAAIEPLGVATPSSAVPGERISIAPTTAVRRTCADLVGVYGGATYLGHVGGMRFQPSPGEGDSVPACEGDVSDAAIEVVVPAIGPGPFVFCVSDDLLPEGCASVAVLRSWQLATTSSIEVVTGDTVVITPAAPVERICTGWVRVFDVTASVPIAEIVDPATGEIQAPAFGGWEAPDCEPETSAAPLTLVVPDLELGAYAFCLSVQPLADACALVYVTAQRSTEPSVPPGSTEPLTISSLPLAAEPFVIEVGTHCGVGSLGLQIDGRSWLTDEAAGVFDWMPEEWGAVIGRDEMITLDVVLSEDRTTLTATANGRSVEYRPLLATDPLPVCA